MSKPEIRTFVTYDHVCNECGTRFSVPEIGMPVDTCPNKDCQSTDLFETGDVTISIFDIIVVRLKLFSGSFISYSSDNQYLFI